MLNNHSKVAIAQIIFYVPTIILSSYVLWRNGSKRPRMAWIPLVPFSFIRLAGGIVVILLQNDPGSVGLIIATVILLGVGVVPLIVSTIGFLRIILASNFQERHLTHRLIIFLRFLFLAAIVCLCVGGGLSGNYESSSSSATGQKIIKAGYIDFAVIIALIVGFQAYLWSRMSQLTKTSIIILKGTIAVIPFLIVRTAYALLSVFSNSLYSKWDSIYGSAIVFAFMALLMEYIVVSIYIYIGLTIPLNRGGARLPTNAAVGNGDQEPGYAERDQALKQPTAFVGGE